jgi:hypothetical protein
MEKDRTQINTMMYFVLSEVTLLFKGRTTAWYLSIAMATRLRVEQATDTKREDMTVLHVISPKCPPSHDLPV